MTILQDMLHMLVDHMTKDKKSNNYKLLQLVSKQFDRVYSDIDAVKTAGDLNKATGKTLALIGMEEGQPRGKTSDEIMRILIRARIARNNTDTSKNSVINALALALNTSPTNFRLKSLYSEGKPLTLRLEKLPINALNAAGMTVPQLIALLQELVGVDVGIESVNIDGTFQFSSVYDQPEQDENTGFADVAQTKGGTLSGVFIPENEIDLPIE